MMEDQYSEAQFRNATKDLQLGIFRAIARHAVGADDSRVQLSVSTSIDSILQHIADDATEADISHALYDLVGAAKYEVIRRIPGFHTLTLGEVQGEQ